MQIASRQVGTLFVFLAVVFGGGFIIGSQTVPGEWYAGLTKPVFNPPNWVFAPVWSILYVFIAIAGWRTWRVAKDGAAMKAWFVQLGLNFLWSPLFFAAEMPGLALVVILAVLGAILTFIVLTWQRDRLSAVLLIPYAAWVGFASLLNAAIYVLN